MTLDLQQVIADRERGTPGRWLYDGHTGVMASGSVDTYGGGVFGRIASSQRTEQRDGDGRTWMVAGSAEANAARIARVPELEAFYITHHNAPAVYAAAERLAEIAGKTAKGPEDFAELAEALQELRKAMGKPSDPETLAMIDALRHGDA